MKQNWILSVGNWRNIAIIIIHVNFGVFSKGLIAKRDLFHFLFIMAFETLLNYGDTSDSCREPFAIGWFISLSRFINNVHYHDSEKPLSLLVLSFPLFAIFILLITTGCRRVGSMKIHLPAQWLRTTRWKTIIPASRIILIVIAKSKDMQDYLNISRHKFKNDLMRKNFHVILMSMLILTLIKTCHFVIDVNKISEMSSNISSKKSCIFNNSMRMKITRLWARVWWLITAYQILSFYLIMFKIFRALIFFHKLGVGK